ncbi:MAG: tRNA (N6-threonylcarbamoyladenosine(37)-N6)-methyltransferase TrmO [Ignavibacteriales bacterium]
MEINLKPVGYVSSQQKFANEMPLHGDNARVEILPEYREALTRITEHTHLWIISWLHEADRNVLSTVPRKVNADTPVYGVFGIRSPRRPNPIGLTLVKLLRVEDLSLIVEGMDAIDGTPVLDIKSYYDGDIIFSAGVADIRNSDPGKRLKGMLKHALAHHGEECADLLTAVRMAYMAEERMGQLTAPDLTLKIKGSRCFADALQGLTRGRLANPERFIFTEDSEFNEVQWTKGDQSLVIKVLNLAANRDEFQSLTDQELFEAR